ncbi:MAG: hypothetical protein C4532_17785 [Candidatus Abyssobacteria bacterium SURF_17]|uniref:Uncharacterized protein n=1 Tax=Candidatus Abyssobacteria bacterium SURF_17 TaxID=2093361 RepID=A0A419EQ48_9BACT|nr:MAG: hypothetical protein C4532_17785 [Candidatus Abyssubacteria bacterium SURF_17]
MRWNLFLSVFAAILLLLLPTNGPADVGDCTLCGETCDPSAYGYELIETFTGAETLTYAWFADEYQFIGTGEYFDYSPGTSYAFGEEWDLSFLGRVFTTDLWTVGDITYLTWTTETYGDFSGHITCNEVEMTPEGPMIGETFRTVGVSDTLPAAPFEFDLSAYDYVWQGEWTVTGIRRCIDPVYGEHACEIDFVSTGRVYAKPKVAFTLPACTDCGPACDPLENGYQLVEHITGEQTTRFQEGALPVVFSDQYWYEAGDITAFNRTWDLSPVGKFWSKYSGPEGKTWKTVWDSENGGEWSGHHTCNDFFGGFGPAGPAIGQRFTITGLADTTPPGLDIPDSSCYDYLWTGEWVIRALVPCPDAVACAIVTFDVTGAVYARPIDRDGDSFAVCEECNDNDSSVYPGAPELCDGKDNNCDGVIPAAEYDLDGDGYRGCEGDCNDSDPDINPAASELPGNMADENCDGSLGNCDPSIAWKNHGQYVRCVAHETDALIEAGVLTQDEGDALISSAAQSAIGK